MSLLPAVGERTAQKIWQKAGGKFIATDKAYLDILEKSLPVSAMPSWKAIRPIMEAYTEENLNEDGGEVIFRFMQAFYEKHLLAVFQDHERRADDIKEVILYTTKFESVEDFLSDIALLTNLDAESEELDQSEVDSLKLSTVHQAKGLEWKAVIMLWVTDGMFPSSRSISESTDGEAEERRLFYVAVTRAKDELVMCVPEVRRNRDGGVIFCEPSRFVNELPRELIKPVNPGFI
jgi:DNA helicase-2/ATP-dependent DNA helicase PcrA